MTVTRVYTAEEQTKIKQLINEGVNVMQEVDDLNGGLTDTIKSIGEELEIKPSVLKKAIKIVHKSDFQKHADDMSELEHLLASVGHIDHE